MSMQSQVRFFLGANSPRGFVSLFSQLEHGEEAWRMFVMKGGPGSGKSTLMKKVAARLIGAVSYTHLRNRRARLPRRRRLSRRRQARPRQCPRRAAQASPMPKQRPHR